MILSQAIAGSKAMWETYLAKTLPLGLAAFDWFLYLLLKNLFKMFCFQVYEKRQPSKDPLEIKTILVNIFHAKIAGK